MNETSNNSNTGKGMSIAGMVLGIVAIVLGCFSSTIVLGILGLACGIVGIILAVKGRKQAIAAGAPTGIGTAGLVLSIIGTVISAILFVSCGLCVACAACAATSAS